MNFTYDWMVRQYMKYVQVKILLWIGFTSWTNLRTSGRRPTTQRGLRSWFLPLEFPPSCDAVSNTLTQRGDALIGSLYRPRLRRQRHNQWRHRLRIQNSRLPKWASEGSESIETPVARLAKTKTSSWNDVQQMTSKNDTKCDVRASIGRR